MGWIKVIVKVGGENFVETVRIICNNYSGNTCETFCETSEEIVYMFVNV